MGRRSLVVLLFAGLLGLGAFWAVDSAQLASAGAEGVRGDTYDLLFGTHGWMVWLSPFIGIFAAALTKRQDPEVQGDRVLRHDGAAILEHWTHGIGTAILLVSGAALGFLFVPRMVSGIENAGIALNVHFVGVVLFLFGTFYYAANTLLALHRFREHLPTSDAIDYTKRHYGLLLGFKKFTMPPERKYFESEKMAYILALTSTTVIIITGFIKVAAHALDVPAGLMAVVTPAHDIATVAMFAFFVAHVFFAAVLPMSWPVLRSMFTGYVALEYAEHEHAGWLAELGHESTHLSQEKKGA